MLYFWVITVMVVVSAAFILAFRWIEWDRMDHG